MDIGSQSIEIINAFLTGKINFFVIVWRNKNRF
jgi:hypothetical protein